MNFLRNAPISVTSRGTMAVAIRSRLVSAKPQQNIMGRRWFTRSTRAVTPIPIITATVTTSDTMANPSVSGRNKNCVHEKTYCGHLEDNNNKQHGEPRNLRAFRFMSSSSKTVSNQRQVGRDFEYDGVPDDVAKLINDHAKQPPTSVSLQALMRTGRGEYLDRHFENVAIKEHTATELVLMQVASFLRRELPIRLAHRIHDLEKVSRI